MPALRSGKTTRPTPIAKSPKKRISRKELVDQTQNSETRMRVEIQLNRPNPLLELYEHFQQLVGIEKLAVEELEEEERIFKENMANLRNQMEMEKRRHREATKESREALKSTRAFMDEKLAEMRDYGLDAYLGTNLPDYKTPTPPPPPLPSRRRDTPIPPGLHLRRPTPYPLFIQGSSHDGDWDPASWQPRL